MQHISEPIAKIMNKLNRQNRKAKVKALKKRTNLLDLKVHKDILEIEKKTLN